MALVVASLVSPVDFALWAQATGNPPPTTAAERAQVLPQVLAFKQAQAAAAQNQRGPGALAPVLGISAAAAAGIGAIALHRAFTQAKAQGLDDATAARVAREAAVAAKSAASAAPTTSSGASSTNTPDFAPNPPVSAADSPTQAPIDDEDEAAWAGISREERAAMDAALAEGRDEVQGGGSLAITRPPGGESFVQPVSRQGSYVGQLRGDNAVAALLNLPQYAEQFNAAQNAEDLARVIQDIQYSNPAALQGRENEIQALLEGRFPTLAVSAIPEDAREGIVYSVQDPRSNAELGRYVKWGNQFVPVDPRGVAAQLTGGTWNPERFFGTVRNAERYARQEAGEEGAAPMGESRRTSGANFKGTTTGTLAIMPMGLDPLDPNDRAAAELELGRPLRDSDIVNVRDLNELTPTRSPKWKERLQRVNVRNETTGEWEPLIGQNGKPVYEMRPIRRNGELVQEVRGKRPVFTNAQRDPYVGIREVLHSPNDPQTQGMQEALPASRQRYRKIADWQLVRSNPLLAPPGKNWPHVPEPEGVGDRHRLVKRSFEWDPGQLGGYMGAIAKERAKETTAPQQTYLLHEWGEPEQRIRFQTQEEVGIGPVGKVETTVRPRLPAAVLQPAWQQAELGGGLRLQAEQLLSLWNAAEGKLGMPLSPEQRWPIAEALARQLGTKGATVNPDGSISPRRLYGAPPEDLYQAAESLVSSRRNKRDPGSSGLNSSQRRQALQGQFRPTGIRRPDMDEWGVQVLQELGREGGMDPASAQRVALGGGSEDEQRQLLKSVAQLVPGYTKTLGSVMSGIPVQEQLGMVAEAVSMATRDYGRAVQLAETQRPELAARMKLAGSGRVGLDNFVRNAIRPILLGLTIKTKGGSGEPARLNLPADAADVIAVRGAERGLSLKQALNELVGEAKSPFEAALAIDDLVSAASGEYGGNEAWTNANHAARWFVQNAPEDSEIGSLKAELSEASATASGGVVARHPIAIQFSLKRASEGGRLNPTSAERAAEDVAQRLASPVRSTWDDTITGFQSGEGASREDWMRELAARQSDEERVGEPGPVSNSILSARAAAARGRISALATQKKAIAKAQRTGQLSADQAAVELQALDEGIQQQQKKLYLAQSRQAEIGSAQVGIAKEITALNHAGLVLDFNQPKGSGVARVTALEMGDVRNMPLPMRELGESDNPFLAIDRQEDARREARLSGISETLEPAGDWDPYRQPFAPDDPIAAPITDTQAEIEAEEGVRDLRARRAIDAMVRAADTSRQVLARPIPPAVTPQTPEFGQAVRLTSRPAQAQTPISEREHRQFYEQDQVSASGKPKRGQNAPGAYTPAGDDWLTERTRARIRQLAAESQTSGGPLPASQTGYVQGESQPTPVRPVNARTTTQAAMVVPTDAGTIGAVVPVPPAPTSRPAVRGPIQYPEGVEGPVSMGEIRAAQEHDVGRHYRRPEGVRGAYQPKSPAALVGLVNAMRRRGVI